MSGDLERALSKLRFDDQVIGYSLMTKGGRPFVSFSFPDDLFPRVKESISLYKTDLRLMTIDTDKGLVVLAPVDDNWILTVLYVPELQLGLAIAKTKNVLRMLEGIELPPPPEEFEEAVESNLEVLESIAMQAASTAAEAAPTVEEPAPAPAQEAEELSPEDFVVTSDTVPKKGEAYATALSLDSDLYDEMRKAYRNFGFDILMLVDGRSTVAAIADAMFQPVVKVAEVLKWAASKRIVELPRAGEAAAEGVTKKPSRFVKCPRFEGDLSKVKPDHLAVVRLCDGTRTTEQIAEAAGIPAPRVIHIVALYRKHGMKMIGKTI